MASLLEGGGLSCAQSATARHSAQRQPPSGAASRRHAHEGLPCPLLLRGKDRSCTWDSDRACGGSFSQPGATRVGACRADGLRPSGRLCRTPLLQPHLVSPPSPPLSLSLLPLSSVSPPSASSYPAADSAADVAGDDDDWDDETFETQRPPERPASSLGLSELDLNRWRQRPVEDKYRIQVERAISEGRMEDKYRIQVERAIYDKGRLQELGVYHWSTWSSPGPCSYFWEWRADEQVFITQGTLTVTPYGCEQSAVFTAGDFVRFPKWLFAELEVSGSFEQRYRFRAYGDDN